MDILYPRCAGLDVHKDTVVACVRVVGNGAAHGEVRTFDTTTHGPAGAVRLVGRERLHPCRDGSNRHLLEARCGTSYQDGEITLILANAAHVKNVPGRKTDVADAVWLADLLAHGLIRASFVPGDANAGDAGLAAFQQAVGARAGQPRPAASRRRWRTPTSSSPRC